MSEKTWTNKITELQNLHLQERVLVYNAPVICNHCLHPSPSTHPTDGEQRGQRFFINHSPAESPALHGLAESHKSTALYNSKFRGGIFV